MTRDQGNNKEIRLMILLLFISIFVALSLFACSSLNNQQGVRILIQQAV